MKRNNFWLVTVNTVIALLLGASAWAEPVGIASGQPTGTNYPMVENIVKVCSTPKATINNVVSDGSIDNVNKVYNDRTSQYGIVQADALIYMQGQDPKMMERIKMVFPFFSTEMHLIVKEGSPIKSLADLAGKKVVEGPEGSGTWVSVQVIKDLTKIKWTPLQASQAEGLAAVLSGKVDAEFIVAGVPVGLLQKSTGYKLIPISHAELDKFGLYTKTLIQSGVYDAVKGTVSTYKVDNLMVTYAFKSQYQKEIGELVTCIANNVEMMQTKPGYHAKWRDVDPADLNRIQWPVHPAAKAAVDRYLKARK